MLAGHPRYRETPKKNNRSTIKRGIQPIWFSLVPYALPENEHILKVQVRALTIPREVDLGSTRNLSGLAHSLGSTCGN